MDAFMLPDNHEDVYEWLRNTATHLHISARFHTELVKQDRNWLYIPVFVEGEDAAVKARILQDIEEVWRNQEPEPQLELLLIPAAN